MTLIRAHHVHDFFQSVLHDVSAILGRHALLQQPGAGELKLLVLGHAVVDQQVDAAAGPNRVAQGVPELVRGHGPSLTNHVEHLVEHQRALGVRVLAARQPLNGALQVRRVLHYGVFYVHGVCDFTHLIQVVKAHVQQVVDALERHASGRRR